MGLFLGIDVSLTCPGFAVLEHGKARHISSQKTKLFGARRWNEIALNLEKILNDFPTIEGIVFEGYGYASFKLGDLAEIGGILRYLCFSQNKLYGSVAPTRLKKWFTGDGRADKKKMMAEAFKRGYLCKNDNESDAVALALYGQTEGFNQLQNLFVPSSMNPNRPKLF